MKTKPITTDDAINLISAFEALRKTAPEETKLEYSRAIAQAEITVNQLYINSDNTQIRKEKRANALPKNET